MKKNVGCLRGKIRNVHDEEQRASRRQERKGSQEVCHNAHCSRILLPSLREESTRRPEASLDDATIPLTVDRRRPHDAMAA